MKRTIETNGKEYKLIKTVGNGGSGNVWEAHANGLIYAIKIVHDNIDSKKKTRFLNECKFSANSNHKHIIRYIDYGVHEEKPFCIMPLYENTLRTLLKDNKLTSAEKFKICEQLCKAIKYIHSKGIIHRDLKPENILIDKKGNVILSDFGIAHFKDYSVTKPNEKLSNHDYHAPEQTVKNSEQIGLYTDIYSLGLLFNEVFTGSIPYGEKYTKVEDVYPQYVEIDELIARMIIQKPQERLKDITIVEAELKILKKRFRQNQQDIIENLIFDASRDGFNKKNLSNIFKTAASDILLGKRVFYYRTERFKHYDPNYNMIVQYKVSNFLFNICVQQQIYHACKKKFSYECAVYKKGESSYENLNFNNLDHVKLYDQMKSILNQYPVSNEYDYSGEILKTFASCVDYHCSEILNDIDSIIADCKKNLTSAPILWIYSYLFTYFKDSDIYEDMKHNNFEIEFEFLIDWESTQYYYFKEKNFDLINKYNAEKKEKGLMILETLQKLYKVKYDIKNDNSIFVLFNSYKEYLRFKTYALKIAAPHYVFEGDVLDLLKIKSQINNKVELRLNSFDLETTLPRILDIDKV